MKKPQDKFEVAATVARAKSRATAFTLIEMITVLTIIIIVLAIAIPVWNALMGGTNLAAAQNQISAFIAGTRADAIYNRQTMGVCFFIDPKTQQTAMAEVQVQTLYQPNPASGGGAMNTSQFKPGTWTETGGSFSWAAWAAFPPAPANNGPIYSIEMANYPDPNTPGNFIFYRDVVILPKGVGVALNNNTYGYNSDGLWNYPPTPAGPPPAGLSPLDRYVRVGVIMFNADGTLASIPYGIPYFEAFTSTQYAAATGKPTGPESLLCSRIGMYPNTNGYSDFASNITYTPGPGSTPTVLPLMSSVGFVLYDRDVFLSQHAGPKQVMDNTTPTAPVQTNIGSGSPFTELDMDYSLGGSVAPLIDSLQAQDKFIEESWIDANGSAFLVTPTSGSLIKAK